MPIQWTMPIRTFSIPLIILTAPAGLPRTLPTGQHRASQIVVNGTVMANGSSNRQIEDAIAEAVKKTHVVPLQFASV